MKHTVKVEELVDIGEWFWARTIASSHGTEDKNLFIECRVTHSFTLESQFVVEGNGERLYVGKYIRNAVLEYNKA